MVRFNKKRGWTLFGRPVPDNEDTMVPDEAVSLEQEPLPSEVEMEEELMSAPVDEPVQISGDPIQHLFSTLGKFNRHMSQAQHAPDSGDWAEKCMNELASGLEIAIACNWTPVKDALIDTARILHSYDCAGRRRDSIPFLNNSYEILSLMVGDLIVDKVRSGVIQKWKDLYGKTLDELKSAGIPLVEDEEEYEAEMEEIETQDSLSTEETEPGYDEAAEDVPYEEEEAPAVPVETHRQEKGMRDSVVEHRAADEKDIPFDLPPLSDPEEDVYEEATEEYEEESPSKGSILAFPGNTVDKHEIESDNTENEAENEAGYEEEDLGEEPPSESEDETVTEEEEPVAETTSEPARRGEEPSLFDVVDEGDQESAPDSADIVEETQADTDTDAVTENVSEEVPEEEIPEEEEPVTDTKEVVTDMTGETESVHEEIVEETAPEPQADKEEEVQAVLDLDVPADAGTPEHLLRQAQAAMSKGDVSSARSVALELALVMARIEFEQSQAAVAEAERSLVDNAQSIKAAQDRVEDAELQLLQVEELLATRDAECTACRDQITGMDEELQQFQSELNDIDAEIEALQRRRAEQVNRMENKRVEREDALNTESRLQTEMESLRENADGIRQDLEALRDDKKQQIENKRDIELSICTAKEEAESRRLSLAAIEQTLAPRAPAAVPEPREGELL